MNEDNKYDAFTEIFHRKLGNHQMPVDSSDWKEINKRLHGKSSSKKKLFVVWNAVAASLTIILTLAYLHNDTESHQLSKDLIIGENPLEYPETTLTVFIPSPKIQTNKNSHEKIVTPNTHEKNAKINTNSTVASGKLEPVNVFQKEPEKQPTETSNGKYQNKTLFTTNYPLHTPKKKKELLLVASFGTSRGVGNNTSIQYPQYDAGEFGYLAPMNRYSFSNNTLIPDNTDGEYLPPLSFGLAIRKNLSTHWGIETGLVYTYLSSNYHWNYSTQFDASQQLHYLGIPVNSIVYFWNNNSKWNAYLSLGMMLEKGLWMKTVRNQHHQGYTVTTTQKSDIDGWQWSLNSSLGISYRFAEKMELYVEPRLSYYFDNDQPMSIRTDWPVSIGVGGGLRYSF